MRIALFVYILLESPEGKAVVQKWPVSAKANDRSGRRLCENAKIENRVERFRRVLPNVPADVELSIQNLLVSDG